MARVKDQGHIYDMKDYLVT